MKSTISLEINRPQAQVAELFSNPRNTTQWMHDVERIEPLSGELGMPGSKYRLVPILARFAIRNAHRRHIEAFKAFAET